MIFGEKYDYSSTRYVNSRTSLEIVCPKHGPFKQLPYKHLNGIGCPACQRNEEFISSAKTVHGDKYDYSLVNYINTESFVKIICPNHGVFTQRPHAHLRGRGCPDCGVEKRSSVKRKTTEMFIQEARSIHGNEYDYSHVNYVNCDEPVEIICKIHGPYFQTPYRHNNLASGCPRCSVIKRGADSRITVEKFIQDARLVHGDKYDYSLVKYTGSANKIKIICPIHGEFEQVAADHLRGIGCRKCHVDSVRRSLPELITEFTTIYHGKYSYEKVVYKNVRTRILVTCPIHGDFFIRPDQHLEGYGCHQCAIHDSESRLERKVREILEKKGIMFEQQKTFPWLKSKNSLFLDFYLPEYNAAIECQGAQHFKAYKFFGGQATFAEVTKRDHIKRLQCADNGVTIIYYSDLGIEYPYLVTEDLDILIQRIMNIGKTDHPIWLPDPKIPFPIEE